MLENTFVHIPGVGPQTEARLWSEGRLSWDDLLENWKDCSFGQVDRSTAVRHIEKSKIALENKEHQFFARGLKLAEAWRAFHEFRDDCVYLDIETDGGTTVTMIGLYDGVEYQALIRGDNLANFNDVISNYSMIVTFAGAMFDLPQLQRAFRGIRFDQIHLDLCPTLRRVGLRGGLKKIEKQLGIARADDVDGMDGMDAVRLWKRYTNFHEDEALETLVNYNREDVVNLERLAEEAYRRLRAQVFEPYLPSEASS